MLCARWLGRRGSREELNAWQRGQRRRSTAGCCAGYDRTLGWALDHAPLVMLPAARRHRAQRAPLHRARRRASCRKQDTGQIGGFIRGDDGLSFQVMQPKIEAFRRAVLKRSGGREHRRIHRRRPRHQQRVDVRPPEAARRAEGVGAGRRGAAPQGRCRRSRAPGSGCSSNRTSASAGAAWAAAAYEYTLLADDTSLLRMWGETVKRGAPDGAGAHRLRRRARLEPAGHARSSTVPRRGASASRWPPSPRRSTTRSASARCRPSTTR